MEKTPHVLLVGEGAALFALQQGFPLETLNTPESVAEWEKRRPRSSRSPPEQEGSRPRRAAGSHDTVTVLALDAKGNLGGVCTTSGLAHKLPGRVGDSPLIGAGLYVDNTAGAAGATGVGEEIIRIGGSLLIVEAMRAGKTPQEACELAVRRGQRGGGAPRRASGAGRVSGAGPEGTCRRGLHVPDRFQYAVARPGKEAELLKATEIAPEAK